MATSRAYISNALVIKALNTPGGSGGVYRWVEGFADDVLRIAVAKAPVNNPLNANHRSGGVGTYKRSFHISRIGSNAHALRRSIYNDAPHARIVEYGRRSTRFAPKKVRGRYVSSDPWERFTWAAIGGRVYFAAGTGGRNGNHILRDAFLAAMTRKQRTFVSATIVTPADL